MGVKINLAEAGEVAAGKNVLWNTWKNLNNYMITYLRSATAFGEPRLSLEYKPLH